MKNKLPFFSVLIPNLGYSPFIFECLNSVINQKTDNLFDYEIIFCDQSDIAVFNKIKKEIESRYGSNKIKLIHSDVRGLLKARHTLMKYCVGEYVQFVDSDDKLIECGLIKLYNQITIGNKPDIIITSLTKIASNGILTEKVELPALEKDDKILDYLLFTNKINSVVIKCFKKSLYSISDYQNFDVTNAEDKLFSYPLVRKANKIILNRNLSIYLYRYNPDSMTNKITISQARDSLFVLDILLEKDFVLNNKQSFMFYNNFLYALTSYVSMLKRSTETKLITQLVLDCREYCKKHNLLNVKVLGFKNKVKSFLFKHDFLNLLIKLC